MRRRLAVAVALLLTVPASSALARPPAPVCRLVTDGAGDAGFFPGVPSATDYAHLDIRSADVASDPKYLTVAVRVADLRLLPDTGAQAVRYSLYFTVRDRDRYVLHARGGQGGASSGLYRVIPNDVHTPAGTLVAWREQALDVETRATFDVARDEVRISVPTGELARHGSPLVTSTRIDDLGAITWSDQSVRVAGVLPEDFGERHGSDTADSEQVYTAGRASCLKPGS